MPLSYDESFGVVYNYILANITLELTRCAVTPSYHRSPFLGLAKKTAVLTTTTAVLEKKLQRELIVYVSNQEKPYSRLEN